MTRLRAFAEELGVAVSLCVGGAVLLVWAAREDARAWLRGRL